MNPDHLDFVIGRYLEGRATDEQSAWLSARLGECSMDLDRMVDSLLVEAELIQLGEEGDLFSMHRRREGWWRRAGAVSVFSAAAAIALAALVLSRIAAPEPEPFAEWRISPGGVVSVAGGEGVDGELSVGSTLRVTQGCAEVTLREGVRCLVQAPGALKMEAEGRVRFEQGVARFRVEEEARGLEVMTKDLKIVDLGTEFGIDARGHDRGEVHVMEGVVEVSARSGHRETMRVEAGAAVALGLIGRLESTLYEPERFVDELPAGIPALHFDFEPAGAEVFGAHGAIARRDRVRLPVADLELASSVPGRQGGVLSFDGDSYAATNWPGIGGTSPRTVAFWIRLDNESRTRGHAILGWGDFRDEEKMSDFGIRTVGESGRLRVVSGRRWLEGERSIIDGRWHHVLVMLGQHRPGKWPEVKLFIDGEEDSLIPGVPWKKPRARLDTFWTEIHSDYSQPLTLGRFVGEGPQYLPGRRGKLDDLIIAEGVITEAQVRAVYEGRLEDSGLDLAR